MSELAAVLDSLSETVTTTAGRVAVTLALVLAVSLVGWLSTRLRRWIDDDVHNVLVDLAISAVVPAAFVLAGAISLGVWGQARAVESVFTTAGIGREAISQLVLTFLILAGTFVLVRSFHRLITDIFAEQEAISDHQTEVTYRVSQITTYVVAIVVVLGVWNVDLSGLLIGAGVLGVIVGMAAQQTLAAVLAGFVLMFSRPFEVGDWIEVEGGTEGITEGTVTDITMVSTRLRTFDGEHVVLPNNVISSQEIINRTREGRLRIGVPVGVDYEADLDHVSKTLKAAIERVDIALDVPAPRVVVTGFGDSSIDFHARVWIDKPSTRRRWRAKEGMIKEINAAFAREGIKIPYPQRELTGREESGGLRLANGESIRVGEVVTDRSNPDEEAERPPQTDGGDG
ncbi:mechanosensitive ion channel family protein [Natronorarus salvus]|uniref:mechanosensitive ion channel family protein n=1 Tax=Natronorarus salvus TaxID=3117733 RepID=UPI002F262213